MTPEERRLRKNESRRRRYAETRPPTGPCAATTHLGLPCRNRALAGLTMCPLHSGSRAPSTCPCGACRVRRSAIRRPAAQPADGQISVRWLLQMAREFDEVGERYPALDFVVWLLPDIRGTREFRNVAAGRVEIGLETARDTMLGLGGEAA